MRKSLALLIIVSSIFIQHAHAKIWRVNNNTGVTADFTNIQAAVDAVAVLAGDTIHVEASASGYGNCYLSKRLVIIGPGYYLTETAPMIANPKTEANTNQAAIGYMYFNPGSKAAVVSGMNIYQVVIQDSLITVQRSYINSDVYFGDSYNSLNGYADTIRQNVIAGGFRSGYNLTNAHYKNILIYNNLIYGGIDLGQNLNNVDGFFINNDFVYYYSSGPGNPISITAINFVFQNNIFGYVNFGAYQTSNVYFNNICMGTGIPAGNSNVQNVDVPGTVYNDWTGSGAGFSSDGRYKLKSSGNPAIGAGTINGGPVDCGAFGGPAPYTLSGMSNMPSIYALTVPTQVNTGTATMNITLSSASH